MWLVVQHGDCLGQDVAASSAASPRLPVAKARKMSPLSFSPPPPIRAMPSVARCADAVEGSGGASVAGPRSRSRPLPRYPARGSPPGISRPTGTRRSSVAGAGQVRLHQRTHGVAAVLLPIVREAVPMPRLERERLDAGPPPTLPSAIGPSSTASARRPGPRPSGAAVDVVEVAVPGFGDHRQRPGRPAACAIGPPRLACTSASRTTPTEFVVSAIGVVSAQLRTHPARSSRHCHSACATPRRPAPGRVAVVQQDDGHAGRTRVAADHGAVADPTPGVVMAFRRPVGGWPDDDAEVTRAHRLHPPPAGGLRGAAPPSPPLRRWPAGRSRPPGRWSCPAR